MKTNKSKYPQNSGFKVPENYFQNFEERLFDSLEEKSRTGLPPTSGFAVPENYFDQLESKLMAKTETPGKVFGLFSYKVFYYAAAAVAVICLLTLGDFFDPRSSSSQVTWNNVEVSYLEDYLEEGYDMGYIELSASDYSDLINGGNLVNDSDFDNINPEEAFEYIDENVEDLTYILER